MNMPVNTTTRRFPRTLHSAFGPYTDNVIETERHCFFRELWARFRSVLWSAS